MPFTSAMCLPKRTTFCTINRIGTNMSEASKVYSRASPTMKNQHSFTKKIPFNLMKGIYIYLNKD